MNSATGSKVNKARIGIVGGGVAGATVACCLGELGLDVTLIEKGPSLVNGPPICHLHAGGNLYREISDEQCLTLLRESIQLVQLYPHAVDYRPTVVAIPTNDDGEPQALLSRLNKLQDEYQKLIDKDINNNVLGPSEHYYKLFSREQIEALKTQTAVDKPKTLNEWMIPIAHQVDLSQLKFPLIMVQEYGLNLFRLAASAELHLKKLPSCSLKVDSKVTDLQSLEDTWQVNYENANKSHTREFDFLINAAGFRTGVVDDMLGFPRQRLVEFKAAYVTKWQGNDTIWPELVFFGERGTPNGMAQFTPYPGGYFQLHGMTESVTLFEKGLVKSTAHSAQPQLHPHFINKIDKGWSEKEITSRTQDAINHLRRFIPAYANNAIVSAKPLFGAQQIPGKDADLRAAGVSFVGEHYARCEIVKASSAPSVAKEIIKQLVSIGYIDNQLVKDINVTNNVSISETDVDIYARTLCEHRGYPASLARCNISKKDL